MFIIASRFGTYNVCGDFHVRSCVGDAVVVASKLRARLGNAYLVKFSAVVGARSSHLNVFTWYVCHY